MSALFKIPELLAGPYGILIRLGLLLLLALGLMGLGAHWMHQWDEAKYDSLVASYKEDQARVEGMDEKAQAASQALTKQKDDQHAKDIAAARKFWYAHGLWDGHSAGETEEPVREASTICGDPARDQRLSAAVDRYERRIVQGIDRFRERVAGLLAACDMQTGQLLNLQDWVQHEQIINTVPENDARP